MTLTANQTSALQSYAAQYGKLWKTKLADDWASARLRSCADMPNRGAVLQGLRNDPNFGHAGLKAFSLSAATAAVVEVPAAAPGTYNEAQRLYIAGLEKDIATVCTPLAVVDYLGRVDADGMVDERAALNRRFGTRDMRHVKIYSLTVVSLNGAAVRDQRVDERVAAIKSGENTAGPALLANLFGRR